MLALDQLPFPARVERSAEPGGLVSCFWWEALEFKRKDSKNSLVQDPLPGTKGVYVKDTIL